MDPYWTLAGIPLRRLELCGCRVGATGAQRLAEALRNPQGAAAEPTTAICQRIATSPTTTYSDTCGLMLLDF